MIRDIRLRFVGFHPIAAEFDGVRGSQNRWREDKGSYLNQS